MKNTKEQLAGIAKTLSSLAKQLERVSKQVGTSTSVKAARKTTKNASVKSHLKQKDTVLDTVLDSIKRSRNGITIPALRSKTGLGARQLSNALYKLTKKNLIQAKSRGVYVKQ